MLRICEVVDGVSTHCKCFKPVLCMNRYHTSKLKGTMAAEPDFAMQDFFRIRLRRRTLEFPDRELALSVYSPGRFRDGIVSCSV